MKFRKVILILGIFAALAIIIFLSIKFIPVEPGILPKNLSEGPIIITSDRIELPDLGVGMNMR